MKFKKIGKIHLIIIVSVALTIISAGMSKIPSTIDGVIKRPEPGENASSKYIDVIGGDGQQIATVNLAVSPRIMSADEVYECFDRAYEEVIVTMLGGNNSCDYVTGDLVLPEKDQSGVIEMSWYSSDYQLINYNGKVSNRGFLDGEYREVSLRLVMEYEDYRSEYEIPVTVYAPEYNSKAGKQARAEKAIEDVLSNNPTDADINLPEYIDGEKVTYKEQDEPVSPVIFIIFGGIAAAVVVISDRKKENDRIVRRKRDLVYDYSEVVSKLTLLMEAGMTTRMAWHKIACDYRDKVNHGDMKRPVYEEMCTTDYNIQAGISETKAYEQFGKRCDTREYMKLATLLQTNIKKGTKELSNLLEKEACDAFEKRKNMARVKGEEATTKLLMPMMLMLITVMMIIMIPAIWSFRM